MQTIHRIYLSFFLITIFLCPGYTQNYEEETGFTFVKAKYLYDTERYDDAIRELNKVIKDNPSWEDALILRGTAKYKLSAYVGTKKDILKYIELKGITPDAVKMLAKAEYQLSEFDAALSSLSTAIGLIQNDSELYEFRASILMDRDQKIKACKDWEASAQLGSTRGLREAQKSCGYVPPVKVEKEIAKDNAQEIEVPSYAELSKEKQKIPPEEIPVKDAETTDNDPGLPVSIPDAGETEVSEDAGILQSEVNNPDTNKVFSEKSRIDHRLLDNTFNTIEIDEDLTLIIYGQGLGTRELLKQPNILILSDEEGRVVIDVCVSRGGRILSTEYNQRESTLTRKSLVSLALRKAKDFWFEKSDLIEQCGKIVYKVKGI